jgi:hypothetical protein
VKPQQSTYSSVHLTALSARKYAMAQPIANFEYLGGLVKHQRWSQRPRTKVAGLIFD